MLENLSKCHKDPHTGYTPNQQQEQRGRTDPKLGFLKSPASCSHWRVGGVPGPNQPLNHQSAAGTITEATLPGKTTRNTDHKQYQNKMSIKRTQNSGDVTRPSKRCANHLLHTISPGKHGTKRLQLRWTFLWHEWYRYCIPVESEPTA